MDRAAQTVLLLALGLRTLGTEEKPETKTTDRRSVFELRHQSDSLKMESKLG